MFFETSMFSIFINFAKKKVELLVVKLTLKIEIGFKESLGFD